MASSNRAILARSSFDLLRNVIFILFLLRWTRISWRQLRGRGILGSILEAYAFLRRRAYGTFLGLPGVREKVELQVKDAKRKMEAKLAHLDPDMHRYTKLPTVGWTVPQIEKELNALSEMKHKRWEDGKVSGTVYHGGKELGDIQVDAFAKFTVSNPIHPDVFPGVRKMEAEVVAMVLSLFNAPEGAAGCCTSGGTESILMACYSARQKAYHERGVTEPEMIMPDTAHAAFLKAGQYFKIKVHLVKCPGPSHKVHIPSVSRLINPNTVLLIGSAPNYAHGIIDDISALSRLAVRHKIPLHIDCCLGSFMVAFLGKSGFPTEPFDFSLRGVTSISCDTHKYGFAPKGSSTVLYRNKKLRQYQYFVAPEWTGGVYGSPSMAGSRPGALIAGCWATMMKEGEEGYIKACHAIVGAAKRVEQGIRTRSELAGDLVVIGKPMVSVVAFTSSTLNIYEIADGMTAKGWHLNALQSPAAIHVAVTLPIVAAIDELLADLTEVVATEKEKEAERIRSGKGKKGAAKGDTATLYGVAGTMPHKGVVVQLAMAFLDTLYKA